ncbi:MAG: GntR family transcriptional regulator [Oscillospiraceae bacterium]|nr:GntR family transcriptional regulator [Oscillospiraceae bacterium]
MDIQGYKLKEYMEKYPQAKLRDLVYTLLYDSIINLQILPGTKLNVNQLASALGISRTPVAEAVALLSDNGFVVSRPGQAGSFVLSLELKDMISLYRARTAIECEAAAICAHSLGESTVRELSLLAEAFKDSVLRKDIRGMKDTDMPFHKLIINSCGNEYIIKSYELLLPRLTMYQSSMTEFIYLSDSEENPWLPSVTYNHISVVSAIRLRLPELARQAMADHVNASLSFTSLFGDGADPFLQLEQRDTAAVKEGVK